ncbi:hypothetical protein FRC08_011554 [Ceratobasidium sp. 394]|nr:hypothetical protein FRC08_011554 [Ceratobasidium sp. 394]
MRPTYCVVFLTLGTLCWAWQATFGDATQCQDMTVEWAGIGGEKLRPPFVVRLAAFGLAPLIINIPTSAWSDAAQSGSYNFTIPWPADTKFVAVMDDGLGSGTGGVTGIQSVKASSNSSCVTSAITQPEHVFDVHGTYIQCSVVSMNWTEPATNATRVAGLVPNGVAFGLDLPVANSKSTTWDLNIPGGTAFVLMYMAPSGSGLTSQLLISQSNGGSNTCLGSGTYPSATASQTGIAQATQTSGASVSAGRSNTSKLGSIIGATLGTVALLCALLVLVFCLYRRKHRFARVRQSPGLDKEINLESNTSQYYRDLPEGAVALPFELPTEASTRGMCPALGDSASYSVRPTLSTKVGTHSGFTFSNSDILLIHQSAHDVFHQFEVFPCNDFLLIHLLQKLSHHPTEKHRSCHAPVMLRPAKRLMKRSQAPNLRMAHPQHLRPAQTYPRPRPNQCTFSTQMAELCLYNPVHAK